MTNLSGDVGLLVVDVDSPVTYGYSNRVKSSRFDIFKIVPGVERAAMSLQMFGKGVDRDAPPVILQGGEAVFLPEHAAQVPLIIGHIVVQPGRDPQISASEIDMPRSATDHSSVKSHPPIFTPRMTSPFCARRCTPAPPLTLKPMSRPTSTAGQSETLIWVQGHCHLDARVMLKGGDAGESRKASETVSSTRGK